MIKTKTTETMPTFETVETVSGCQAAVQKLERESYVAVDSEGVHLSRTGPLTLLQIGTASGRVFLFDVMQEPLMFEDGGLRRLLEDESVVKVLHSARNDGEALHAQFRVGLRNVHDTQLAHMEVERAEGRTVPQRLKLEEICKIYCPAKVEMLTEGKDAIQTKWNKLEGEYWAKRPLTPEMIKYAANDVIAIVPEVYMAQKQLLEKKGLTRTFREHVERDLNGVYDQAVRDQLNKEERELLNTTLRNFAETASRHTQLQDITDESVLHALSRLQQDEILALGLPQFITDLKLQSMKNKLDETEDELRRKGTQFEPNGALCRRLYNYVIILEDGPTKQQAERLLQQINDIVLEDVKRKYTVSTPVAHLATHEKRLLTRSLRPKGEHDSSVHPVHLHLYWAIKLEDLKHDVERYRADPRNYTVTEGYVRSLKFYLSGPVPAGLKQMGTDFLHTLEDAGKVNPPPSGARRGGGSRRPRR